MITVNDGIITKYYDKKDNFPALAEVGDYFIVTPNGTVDEPIKRVYQYFGEWKLIYSNNDELNGKDMICAGDSITANVNATSANWCDVVAWNFGMNRVKKIRTTNVNYANSGTTAINLPNPIASTFPNLVQITELTPNFNPAKDGLFFMAYLTNDVGLNLPNFTVQKYKDDLGQALTNLLNKGWPVERIKVIGRYYCPIQGLNYTTVANSGVTVPATYERYDEFGIGAEEVCNLFGVQCFDLNETLKYVAGADSHFDSVKRHFDSFMHSHGARKIIDDMII